MSLTFIPVRIIAAISPIPPLSH